MMTNNQPFRLLLAVRPVACTRRAQISFLHQIFCLGGVARQRHGIPVERINVLKGCLSKHRVALGLFIKPL